MGPQKPRTLEGFMIFMVKKPGFLGGQHNLCFYGFGGLMAYMYICMGDCWGDNKLIDENGAVGVVTRNKDLKDTCTKYLGFKWTVIYKR